MVVFLNIIEAKNEGFTKIFSNSNFLIYTCMLAGKAYVYYIVATMHLYTNICNSKIVAVQMYVRIYHSTDYLSNTIYKVIFEGVDFQRALLVQK